VKIAREPFGLGIAGPERGAESMSLAVKEAQADMVRRMERAERRWRAERRGDMAMVWRWRIGDGGLMERSNAGRANRSFVAQSRSDRK
jgi:hypothetical protein